MDPLSALLVIAALVAVSIGAGLVARARSGRRSRTRTADVAPAEVGLPSFGAVATIVQLSTEMCARCPAMRRTLARAAEGEADVALTEVDLTHRPELATRFRVLQTPTVLILDREGTVAARYAGAVTGATIREEISALRRAPDVPAV